MLTSARGPMVVLLVGGTSEIALSVVTELATRRALRVVLAARPGAGRDKAHSELIGRGCAVEVINFEATDLPTSLPPLGEMFTRMTVDVAVVAQGVLPDQHRLESDPLAAVGVCSINYTASVVVGLLLADRMQTQGHGVIVALSSVAALRPRVANYIYGSTKAGLDAFYTGLRDRLRPSGVRVLVVRPGHVHTRMTRGLSPAPFAVGPEQVADAVARHLPTGNDTVWVPLILGPVMTLLRFLPGPLFRRVAGAPRAPTSQRSLRGRPSR